MKPRRASLIVALVVLLIAGCAGTVSSSPDGRAADLSDPAPRDRGAPPPLDVTDSVPEPAADSGPPAPQPLPLDAIGKETRDAFLLLEPKLRQKTSYTSANGAALAWGESYILMAYIVAFETLADEGLLEHMLQRIDAIWANRSDRLGVNDQLRNKIIPGWASTEYTDGKAYNWLVHAGMITYPIARLVYTIRADPYLEQRYGDKATTYLADLRTTIAGYDPYYEAGSAETGNYSSAAVSPLPYNQQNALGRTLAMMWLITGEATYRDKARGLGLTFADALSGNPTTGYTWAYGKSSSGAEDISHAAINVDFSFIVARLGIAMRAAYVKGFASTLLRLRSGTDGFYHDVDGTGDLSMSVQIGRWGQLGFDHPEVREALVRYYRGNWDKSTVACALAAAYLMRTSVPWDPSPLP